MSIRIFGSFSSTVCNMLLIKPPLPYLRRALLNFPSLFWLKAS
nr:MAG TPA: hypothetical protein [Bacteriophage sp.]